MSLAKVLPILLNSFVHSLLFKDMLKSSLFDDCDRTGVAAEKRLRSAMDRLGLSQNVTMFDLIETLGEGQSLYSAVFATSDVVCFDNLGYYGDAKLPTVKRSSGASTKKCPWSISDQYGQNMYNFMVTDGLEKNALQGKNILEVGCGRGKGAAYIAQAFNPAKYMGVDLNKDRIDIASKFWRETPNVDFMVGNAMDLPIEQSSMDFVVNVESSFHYPNFQKFLQEVFRVLKPGGTFLWTAPLLNRGDSTSNKVSAFRNAGFEVVKEMDITDQVVEGRKMQLQTGDPEEFKYFCSTLENWDSPWAYFALPGSLSYKALETRETPYIRIIASKPVGN